MTLAASSAALGLGIGVGVVLLVVGLLWIAFATESDWWE